MGCLPILLTAKASILRTCIEIDNSDSIAYNYKILYADIYTHLLDMINKPLEYDELLSLIFLLQCCITSFYRCNGQNLSNIPAILVFGDSAVDSGNNNYISTIFKANYSPYGMDFPGHIPTGRFSDGKLSPDILASMLGLKDFIPPFLQPNLPDHELLTGVCFASAGSGLDDQTTAFSNSIPMSKQPAFLADYIERLERIVGNKKDAQTIVNEALVIIHAGGVDFIYNFYLIASSRRVQYSITEYQNLLLSNLQSFLKKLYELGSRKMAVSGLPPLGCLPVIMTAKSPLLRTCLLKVNMDVQSYNEKLVKLLPQVEAELPGSKIIYSDTFSPFLDMINNPQKYGFLETARGCCGTGLVEAGQLCNPLSPVCKNPSQYVFWDSIHPTESAHSYLTEIFVKKFRPNLRQNHRN